MRPKLKMAQLEKFSKHHAFVNVARFFAFVVEIGQTVIGKEDISGQSFNISGKNDPASWL